MPGRSRFRGLIHCKLGFTLLRFSSFRLAQEPCSGNTFLHSLLGAGWTYREYSAGQNEGPEAVSELFRSLHAWIAAASLNSLSSHPLKGVGVPAQTISRGWARTTNAAQGSIFASS